MATNGLTSSGVPGCPGPSKALPIGAGPTCFDIFAADFLNVRLLRITSGAYMMWNALGCQQVSRSRRLWWVHGWPVSMYLSSFAEGSCFECFGGKLLHARHVLICWQSSCFKPHTSKSSKFMQIRQFFAERHENRTCSIGLPLAIWSSQMWLAHEASKQWSLDVIHNTVLWGAQYWCSACCNQEEGK